MNNHPLNVFFDFQLVQSTDAEIIYGGEIDPNKWYMPSQKKWLSKGIIADKGILNTYHWKDKNIYSLECIRKETGDFVVNKQFQFDFFETAFFHLSRYEEWQATEDNLDLHGRVKDTGQVLVKAELQEQAVLDLSFVAFLEVLVGSTIAPRRTQYKLTHDIDVVRKWRGIWNPMRYSMEAVRRQQWRALLPLWKNYGSTILGKVQDPYDVAETLMQSERWPRTLYFLSGGHHRFDRGYNLADTGSQRLLNLALEKGVDIGLHPSYLAMDRPDLIAQQIEILASWSGQKINKSRQHFLRWKWPDTLYALEQAGITEDSTLGYHQEIGFRAGTGFCYEVYDLQKDRPSGIIEQPLVWMDVAHFRKCNYQPEKVFNFFISFLEKNKYNTCITFNFHNSRFDDAHLHRIDLWGMLGIITGKEADYQD